MEERDLVSLIEGEVTRSIGHWQGTLSAERKMELDYYFGRPFGNEVEGESQVVSTDVADTVEGLLPSLLRIFTASDDAVRFDPNGPEDEDQAAQQTEVANYVFYRQNNGFLVLYEWFKDALIQKNGIVKYWWEKKDAVTKESYQGLTEGEYQGLVTQQGIEVIEHAQYDDPTALQQKDQLMQQAAQQMPPEQMMMVEQQAQTIPVPQLHDVTIKITKDDSKICIQAIPPEEFGISAKHNCVSIQETPFCYHRSRKSISSLRAEGCPEDILANLSGEFEPDITPEALARDRFYEDRWVDDSADESSREVWVTECFIRLDYDGDGIAELRHMIIPGRSVWINEETEHINFAAVTPIIMPHRWVGRSMSELVMDIQLEKSVLKRQMLNNLYLTNNPQKVVLSSAGGIVQANLDDLLTSRPGGIIREYVANSIRHVETPFVAGASFPMIEYLDGVKEARTGLTRYNQGTDADSLNKTARGISLIQSAGQQRLDLIARIFAETGLKDLMRGIVYMLSKYSSKEMTIKLRNKWVDVDPRGWKTQFNMTINVGLGTGNKDIQLAHLGAMAQKQNELLQTGRSYMVSDENIYNLYKKTSEAMGFKHPELFISDPASVPQEAKQKGPSPEMAKIMAETEMDKQKLQFGQWKEQMSAETMKAIEAIKAQSLIMIAEMDNKTKEAIAAAQRNTDMQIEIYKHNNSLEKQANEIVQREQDLKTAEALLTLKKQVHDSNERTETTQ